MNTPATPNKIHIIFGATASGKTSYGVELAKKLGGEVINADSQQVYIETPILSAQPTAQEKQGIPHHMYAFISCFEPYSVGQYVMDVSQKIMEIRARGNTPILVGGTGLYIKSLVEGLPSLPRVSNATKANVSELATTLDDLHPYLTKLDPITAAKLSPGDTQRIIRALEVVIESGQSLYTLQMQPRLPNFKRGEFHITWLNPDRKLLYDKINKRFLDMLELGAVAEVSALIIKARGRVLPKSHGIPEIQSYLEDHSTLAEAIAKSQQVVRNYAKRQLTWARHQLVFDEVLTKA